MEETDWTGRKNEQAAIYHFNQKEVKPDDDGAGRSGTDSIFLDAGRTMK